MQCYFGHRTNMLECLEENFKMIKICAKQNESGRQWIN